MYFSFSAGGTTNIMYAFMTKCLIKLDQSISYLDLDLNNYVLYNFLGEVISRLYRPPD